VRPEIAPADDFVHLHVHSEFSLLDGLSRRREMTQRAADLGMKALAATDHGAMFGAKNEVGYP
jgi:DNA polymerase-3 subunit alpha